MRIRKRFKDNNKNTLVEWDEVNARPYCPSVTALPVTLPATLVECEPPPPPKLMTLADMQIGDVCYKTENAVCVTQTGEMYVYSYLPRSTDPNFASNPGFAELTRVEGGFRLDLTRTKPKWKFRISSLPYASVKDHIPIVELIY